LRLHNRHKTLITHVKLSSEVNDSQSRTLESGGAAGQLVALQALDRVDWQRERRQEEQEQAEGSVIHYGELSQTLVLSLIYFAHSFSFLLPAGQPCIQRVFGPAVCSSVAVITFFSSVLFSSFLSLIPPSTSVRCWLSARPDGKASGRTNLTGRAEEHFFLGLGADKLKRCLYFSVSNLLQLQRNKGMTYVRNNRL
jgi:hypothetical protein